MDLPAGMDDGERSGCINIFAPQRQLHDIQIILADWKFVGATRGRDSQRLEEFQIGSGSRRPCVIDKRGICQQFVVKANGPDSSANVKRVQKGIAEVSIKIGESEIDADVISRK